MSSEVDLVARKLLVPSLPSIILLGFGAVDIAWQAKQLRQRCARGDGSPRARLDRLEAGSRFLEESLIDVATLFAASVAINWLYRSGLKPLAWLCIVVPLLLVSLTIVLHIAKLRQRKQSKL